MEMFRTSKSFPKEEKYSLTDQIRRSSRSITANIAEAWAKKIYVKSFISKLSDALGEEYETEIWLDFSLKCKYIDQQIYEELYDFSLKCKYIDQQIYEELYEHYDHVLGKLVNMSLHPEKWTY
jgi:four helix bundle protein